MVAASCARVLTAIDEAPDDDAFVTTQDASGKTAADYSLLVAQDKAGLAAGLGATSVSPVPPAFSTRDQAKTTISQVEQNLEDAILRMVPDDYWKPPSTLGYPINCDLDTYYDCVVAHSGRDVERADTITAIFA